MLTVPIGILIDNSRLTDLRSHMDSHFDDMRATWHSELRRLDARLKHLEERLRFGLRRSSRKPDP